MEKTNLSILTAFLIFAAVSAISGQTQINLKKSFAESLADRICIKLEFTPDSIINRNRKMNDPVTNGRSAYFRNKIADKEIYLAGTDSFNSIPILCKTFVSSYGTEAEQYLKSRLKKKTDIYGVWRLWIGNFGNGFFNQGEKPDTTQKSDEYFFEISPSLKAGGNDLDYSGSGVIIKSRDIESALESYSNARLTASSRDSVLTICTGGAFNEPVHFILEKSEVGEIFGDGTIAVCNIYNDDGFLIYKDMRIIFIKDSEPERGYFGLKIHEKLNVTALPRISIHDILLKLNANESECSFQSLPVEMIILSTYNN